MNELEPVRATGFHSLTDFKRPRSWPLVLAFYAFYAFVGIIVSIILSMIFLPTLSLGNAVTMGDGVTRTYEQNMQIGMISGAIFATAYCLSICLLIIYQRRAWRDPIHLVALLATLLCGPLIGSFGAMIPPSLLLLRVRGKIPIDTPRQ